MVIAAHSRFQAQPIPTGPGPIKSQLLLMQKNSNSWRKKSGEAQAGNRQEDQQAKLPAAYVNGRFRLAIGFFSSYDIVTTRQALNGSIDWYIQHDIISFTVSEYNIYSSL